MPIVPISFVIAKGFATVLGVSPFAAFMDKARDKARQTRIVLIHIWRAVHIQNFLVKTDFFHEGIARFIVFLALWHKYIRLYYWV